MEKWCLILIFYVESVTTPLSEVEWNKQVKKREFFGWILQKIIFICNMGTVQNYLENWWKRVNFENGVAEILTKVWEGKDKWCGGRREKKFEFRLSHYWNSCYPILCPLGEVLEVLGGVLKRETNCGNQVVENLGRNLIVI